MNLYKYVKDTELTQKEKEYYGEHYLSGSQISGIMKSYDGTLKEKLGQVPTSTPMDSIRFVKKTGLKNLNITDNNQLGAHSSILENAELRGKREMEMKLKAGNILEESIIDFAQEMYPELPQIIIDKRTAVSLTHNRLSANIDGWGYDKDGKKFIVEVKNISKLSGTLKLDRNGNGEFHEYVNPNADIGDKEKGYVNQMMFYMGFFDADYTIFINNQNGNYVKYKYFYRDIAKEKKMLKKINKFIIDGNVNVV